jgi:hypothetical protein
MTRRDGELLVMPDESGRWHVARWHGHNGPVSVLDCRDEYAANQAMDFMVKAREQEILAMRVAGLIDDRIGPNERALRAVA